MNDVYDGLVKLNRQLNINEASNSTLQLIFNCQLLIILIYIKLNFILKGEMVR